MTSPNPVPDPTIPTRPGDAAEGAMFDAIVTENAAIYGYGVVSAHSVPEVNYLVSDAMAQRRRRREEAVAILDQSGIAAPLPAAGYSLPIEVDTPADAAKLAVTMEQDSATAWRAVLEQATDQGQRAFAVTALTDSGVMAARWRRVLKDPTITVAFPGGSE